MSIKQKLIAVVGPTASGKTGLAVEIAKRFHGEIISADSRQVYKHLDLGTEKTSEEEMQGIPHYCIDIASPKRSFSVEQWRRRAQKALETIQKHGALPIVAGGTGFYVDALIYNYTFPKVPPNHKLRTELSRKSVDELFEILLRLDERRAQTIESKNPRRLVRAIEIAVALGKVPSLSKRKTDFDVLWVGLYPGLDELMYKIKKRFNKTLESGLIVETNMVKNQLGLSWKRIHELGLEYRIVGEYIRGEITIEEMREKNIRELRKYAKRQMTWLKRNTEIKWFKNGNEALKKSDIENFLSP